MINVAKRWRDLSLRGQLWVAFTAFCLLTTGLFSLYAFAFAYSVEDEFFATMLEEQAQRQLQHFAKHGQWLDDKSGLQMYFEIAQMPADLGRVLAQEPRRSEVAGTQGRHYHVVRMALPDHSEAWLVAEVSNKLVFRRMRGTVLEILIFSTLSLLLAALTLAWFLARTTALPITRLSMTLAALNPQQLPENLPCDAGVSEVGMLTRGLSELVQRIRKFIAREQSFTRDVSHELRTPLTVIRCTAEQLLTKAALEPEVQSSLNLILQASAQLQQTVHTLLVIAREENADIPQTPCRLTPLLEQVVLEQAPLLADKTVELRLNIAHDLQILGREPVLRIMLANLLGNAFAHCDSPSAIEVFVRDERLCIRNTSQYPIAEESFEAFHKHGASTGFGLGLSIAQRLSERFGLALQCRRDGDWVEASFNVSASPR